MFISFRLSRAGYLLSSFMFSGGSSWPLSIEHFYWSFLSPGVIAPISDVASSFYSTAPHIWVIWWQSVTIKPYQKWICVTSQLFHFDVESGVQKTAASAMYLFMACTASLLL